MGLFSRREHQVTGLFLHIYLVIINSFVPMTLPIFTAAAMKMTRLTSPQPEQAPLPARAQPPVPNKLKKRVHEHSAEPPRSKQARQRDEILDAGVDVRADHVTAKEQILLLELEKARQTTLRRELEDAQQAARVRDRENAEQATRIRELEVKAEKSEAENKTLKHFVVVSAQPHLGRLSTVHSHAPASEVYAGEQRPNSTQHMMRHKWDCAPEVVAERRFELDDGLSRKSRSNVLQSHDPPTTQHDSPAPPNPHPTPWQSHPGPNPATPARLEAAASDLATVLSKTFTYLSSFPWSRVLSTILASSSQPGVLFLLLAALYFTYSLILQIIMQRALHLLTAFIAFVLANAAHKMYFVAKQAELQGNWIHLAKGMGLNSGAIAALGMGVGMGNRNGDARMLMPASTGRLLEYEDV